MPDEGDVVRSERLEEKPHVRLLQNAVPLAVVASDACADEVLPCVGPAA